MKPLRLLDAACIGVITAAALLVGWGPVLRGDAAGSMMALARACTTAPALVELWAAR
jgi:hypothetical protein